MAEPVEKPLTGGNMTEVARRGGEVLRESGPWTPTIQRLLAHLRAAGVDWCPEPRGWVEDGREALSYLKGKVPTYPLPGWVYDEAVLVRAAQWLRTLHDATEGYIDAEARWRSPVRQPAEVVCHNDFAPYNMVFRNEVLVGVIDWDFAAPGPRLWDIAHLAYRLVPLTSPGNPDAPTGSVDLAARLHLLLDSYGSDASMAAVLDAVIARLEDLAAFTHGHALLRKDEALASDALLYSTDAAYLRSLRG